MGLTWSFAISLICAVVGVSGRWYFKGLSKAQTAPARIFVRRRRKPKAPFFTGLLPGPMRALVLKEVRTFFRDKTQWSQIFLVVALVVIYLYNFSVLPIDKSPVRMEYLRNLISFLNVALAAFVLSAVSARFVFPAVSREGEALWIVRSAPISIRTFLWTKFLVYFFPLLILSVLLTVITNLLLQVTPFIMVLSILTMLCLVPAIVALGIGLGAIYPDFHSENSLQSVTGLGGLLYMTLSLGLVASVVVLEAGPVYSIFMSGIRGTHLGTMQWVWMLTSFVLVLLICSIAVIVPMRLGERQILSGKGGPARMF